MNMIPALPGHAQSPPANGTVASEDILGFAGGASGRTLPRWMLLVGLCVAQIFLARAMSAVPILGLGQALAIVGIAGFAAMKRNAMLMVCVMVYLPAVEITWRQARVPVPFLSVPYLLTGFALMLTFLMYPHLTRPGRIAALYFGLMLPSIVVTISTAGEASREAIAFALSGPAALAAMVILFSQMKIEPWFYRRLLWIMVISGLGPLTIALSAINEYIVNTGELEFGTGSNAITSGGFGPVQVSSVMGLTVLATVLLFFVENQLGPRLLCIGIGILAAVQSFLTFSRGGMFATALALGALALSQAQNRDTRRRVLAVVAVVFAFGYFIVVPQVDSFTKGAFEERFSDTSSGRTELASSDLEIFSDNLVFGVGPGMSKYRRLSFEVCELRTDRCKDEGSSHTEFTRMPSEHGLAGVLGVGLIIVMSVQAFRRAVISRPVTVTMLTWAVAQMFYANLRVAAVPMAFAFAFLRIEARSSEDSTDDDNERERLALL